MNSPALEIKDISVSFRGVVALEEINMTLEPGDFVGIIGPNGAGKSVLLKVVLGLLKPDRGSIRIFGRPPRRAHGLVSYVPQHASFDREFPIAVLDVVLMGRLGRRKLLRRLNDEDRDRARAALRRVEMEELADRQIGGLSGGQIQRVLIARALAVDAKLLLLDEPTSNLDTPMVSALYRLLDELSSEITIVLVAHDVGVMSKYVRSVACLNRRLFHHGPGELTPEIIERTYGESMDVITHRHEHGFHGEHPAGGER